MAEPCPMPTPSGMRQSEHETMKMAFENKIGHRNQRNRHKKTSVLQLSWEREHSDLKVEGEIKGLREVLESKYGFKVQQTSLDPEKPQQQALMDLATFVFNEDDADALLIIYYAGHGHGVDAMPGDIKLLGKKLPNPDGSIPAGMDPVKELETRQTIVWSKVETAIRETRADVLLIFDCCDAGRLARPLIRNAQPTSSFQFLGACSEDQITKGPGKESFTAALIWALTELAENDRAFNTPELRATIMAHEHFPNEQVPVLSDRRGPYEHIMISKSGLANVPTTPVPTAHERDLWEHVDLRFHFEHPVEVRHVEHVADALNALHALTIRREGGLPWSKIGFLSKSSLVREVAKIAIGWRERTRYKSISKYQPPVSSTGLLVDSEEQLASTAMDYTLSPQISRLQMRASPSESSPDRFRPAHETQALLSYSSIRYHDDNQTIPFHLRAIARRFRVLLSQAFSYIARRLIPRSRNKNISDEVL